MAEVAAIDVAKIITQLTALMQKDTYMPEETNTDETEEKELPERLTKRSAKRTKAKRVKTPPKIYVHKVELTSFKGVSGTFTLGPTTAIIGPNGSGKDAILQAVDVALRGRASDIAGKSDVGQAHALARAFCRGPGTSAHVKLTLSDGTEATWSAAISSGGTASVQHDGVSAPTFPLVELRKLFESGGLEAKRGWVLKQICGEITRDEVIAQVPPGHAERFGPLFNITTRENPEADVSELLELTRKEARRRAKSQNGEATAAQKAMDRLAAAGRAPSAKDLEDGRVRMEAAKIEMRRLQSISANAEAGQRAAADASWNAQAHARREGTLQGQLTQLEAADLAAREHYQSLRADGQEATNALAKQKSELALELVNAAPVAEDLLDMWKGVKATAEGQIKYAPSGDCILCKQPGDPDVFAATLTQADHALQDLEEQYAGSVRAEVIRARAAVLQGQIDSTHASINDIMVAGKSRVEKIAEIKGMLASMETVTPAFHVEVETEQDLIDSKHPAFEGDPALAIATYERLKAATNSDTLIQKLRGEREAAKTEKDIYNRMADLVDEIIADALLRGKTQFLVHVAKYMPAAEKMPCPGDTFDLILENAKGKGVCELCLVDADGFAKIALSGAEWNIVLTAIVLAATEQQTCAVVIPEERTLDGGTFAAWLRAVKSAPQQFIIAHAVDWKGGTPAGVTKIELKKRAAIVENVGSEDD